MGTGAPSYKGFRFPAEIINHCLWLYYRFPLSKLTVPRGDVKVVGTFVLVRPDGYIGAISTSPDTIRAYLNRVTPGT